MQRERKKEIDKELIDTEQGILAGEIKTITLDEFKERQKQKRIELRNMSRALKVKRDISTYLRSHKEKQKSMKILSELKQYVKETIEYDNYF